MKFKIMLPDWFFECEASNEAEAEAKAIEALCKELRDKKAGLLVEREISW